MAAGFRSGTLGLIENLFSTSLSIASISWSKGRAAACAVPRLSADQRERIPQGPR